MAQPFNMELHGQVGWLLGVPVFESTTATHPVVIKTPIPGTRETRVKLIVPDYKEFQDEIWIEQTLHRVVSEQMGDTLEWLYGDRKWISPSSRYSKILAQIQLANQWNAVFRGFRDVTRRLSDAFASTTRSVSQAVGGLSAALGSMPDYGSTATPDAENPST